MGAVSVLLSGCTVSGGADSTQGQAGATTTTTVSTTVTTTQAAETNAEASENQGAQQPFPHAQPGVYTDDSLDYRAMHQSLEIKGRAPKTGYDRERFGSAWTDDVNVAGGRNGCDTRNDILQRDLAQISVRNGTHGCLVESGEFTSRIPVNTLTFAVGTIR